MISKSDSSYLRGAALVFAATLCFAFQPVFGRLAYEDGANPVGLLWLRFVLAALMLHWFSGGNRSGRRLQPLLIGSVLSAGALAYFSALQQLSTGLTTLLFFLFPIYIFFISVCLRQEQLSLLKAAAVMLAVTGVCVSVDFGGDFPLPGVLFGLAAGACYGAYICLSNHFLAEEDPLWSLRWIATGAAICFSVAVLAGEARFPGSWTGYGAVTGLSLICTLLSLQLLLAGSRLMARSTDISVLTTTEIATTLFLAWLILNETIHWQEIIGSVLVFTAALMIVLGSRPQRAEVATGKIDL